MLNNEAPRAALGAAGGGGVYAPLDTGQDGGDIVGGAPSILEDIETELAGGIDVGMEHLADEFHGRWLVRILFLEMHHEPEGSILERRVGGANNDRVPARGSCVSIRVLGAQ